MNKKLKIGSNQPHIKSSFTGKNSTKKVLDTRQNKIFFDLFKSYKKLLSVPYVKNLK